MAPRFFVTFVASLLSAATLFGATLQLTDAQLLDRIKGGWVAKSAANSLGQPYEGAGPDQNRNIATTFGNGNLDVIRCGDDDTYCPMPYLTTMDSLKYGPNGIYTATMQDYATAFEKTTYPIFCANAAAMAALKSGVNPPYSGGWPLNGKVMSGSGCTNPAPEALGFSFYSQWIGFVTPGLPAQCLKIDSICGHIIVYANGMYATEFLDVACSIAPLYTDIHTIVKEARKALPLQCDIGRNIDTIIWYHDNNPTKTYWDAMNWALGGSGQTAHTVANDGENGSRVNTSIVVIGLLWGDGDMMTTTLDVVRMGQDADCNGGDAGAVLGSMLGYANLPQGWKTAYETITANGIGCTYSGTGVSGWDFVRVVDSSVAIAKAAILQSGGSYANGVYTIQVEDVPAPQWLEEYGKVPQPLDSNAVQARIAASPVRGAAPLACSFDASSSIGHSLKYAWNFGDATPVDTHVTAQHTFQNTGTYSVELVVSNTHGTDSSHAVIVVVDSSQLSYSYEAESLATTCTTGRTTYVSTEAGNSRGAAVMITDNTPVVGDWLEFTFNVPAAGTYDVSVFFKSNNNRGIVQPSIDGAIKGGVCEEYAATAAYQVPFDMGNVVFTAGNHSLRFTITGKNSASTNYNVHVDKIALSRITSTRVGSAMHRPGVLNFKVTQAEKMGTTFQLLSPAPGSFTLQVQDVAGRKIWEAKDRVSPVVVWSGAAKSGFYLATVIQGDKRTTQRFFVEK